MNPITFSLAVALLYLVPQVSWAMRCGGRIVSEGDTQPEVHNRCGEPTIRDRVIDSRLLREQRAPNAIRDRIVSVVVERWVYARDSRELMRILIFENGVLQRIETGSRVPSSPGSAEQCQPEMHRLGVSSAEIRLRCGGPSDSFKWVEHRYDEIGSSGSAIGPSATIVHERWIYNFGPSRFMRIFRFANGRLVGKETGSYGF